MSETVDDWDQQLEGMTTDAVGWWLRDKMLDLGLGLGLMTGQRGSTFGCSLRIVTSLRTASRLYAAGWS